MISNLLHNLHSVMHLLECKIFKRRIYRKRWYEERALMWRESSWEKDKAFVLENRKVFIEKYGKGCLVVEGKKILAFEPTWELAEIDRYLISYKTGIYLYSINIFDI